MPIFNIEGNASSCYDIGNMIDDRVRQYGLIIGAIVLATGGYWSWNYYWDKKILEQAWPMIEGGTYQSPVTRDGVTSLVPGDEVYNSGIIEGGMPALIHPKYASVFVTDILLSDDSWGIDVEIGDERRYYPVGIMNWHEVVNDTIGTTNFAVTYCPLCGTAVVYNRNYGGSVINLSARGQVYNNNSILKDDVTSSLWLQATGESIQGTSMGEKLTVIPSTMMTWGKWRKQNPYGLALSTKTGFTRDYARNTYAVYQSSAGMYFPSNYLDGSHKAKDLVTYNGVRGYWGCLSALHPNETMILDEVNKK